MPKIPFKAFRSALAAKSKQFLDVEPEGRKYLQNVSRYWQRLARTWGVAIEDRTPEKNVDMATEIKKLANEFRKEHKCSLFDINNGLCDDFAEELVKRTGGAIVGMGHSNLIRKTIKQTEHGPTTFWSEPDLPGHVWVFWKGKHYDAENPMGVKNWKDLKIFKSQDVFKHE